MNPSSRLLIPFSGKSAVSRSDVFHRTEADLKTESIADNIVFLGLYHILYYVIPLTVTPYVTRVLGTTALGVYQFSYTAAYYFVMAAMLGILKYGQRLIAVSAPDSLSLRRNFWSLYFLHFCISVFAVVLYVLFVTLFVTEDRTVYYLQTGYVASAVFDVTWFFQGIEDFKSVLLRNAVLKLIECGLIFAFVKSPDDLHLYTLIVSSSLLLGQFVMLTKAARIVRPIRFTECDVRRHLKPLLVLAVSVFAVSLYTVFDKTLLGLMSSKQDVALYEYSNRIITIPKKFLAIIGTVLFPRSCKLAGEGDTEGLKRYMSYAVLLTAMIGFGSFWGLMATAPSFAVIYFGEDFALSGKVIMALSPNILIIEFGGILRTQYLIPKEKDREFTIGICLNAAINLVLSITLIPFLGIYGAVAGTTAAEIFGLIYQMNLSKEVIRWRDFFREAVPFCIIGAVMFAFLKVIDSLLHLSLLSLVIQIVTGAVFYLALSWGYLTRFRPGFASLLIDKLKGYLGRR